MTYYHYTSLNAFYSIITGKTFRLTNLRSSNDALELYYDIDQFSKDLSNIIATEKDPPFKTWLIGIREGINLNEREFLKLCKPPKKGDVFGLSLCSIRDNLTHWDRYADRCAGICIGIDDSFIERAISKMHISYFGGTLLSINDVIYEREVKGAIRELFYKFYRSKEEDTDIMTAIYNNNPHAIAVVVYTKVARFAKPQAFIDEHETRIFHDNADIKETQGVIKSTLKGKREAYTLINNRFTELVDNLHLGEIQYYVSPNRGIRAYKELCLADVWDSATIPEVLIGPMCPQSKDELKAFLKANGLKGTKVYGSKVSIR